MLKLPCAQSRIGTVEVRHCRKNTTMWYVAIYILDILEGRSVTTKKKFIDVFLGAGLGQPIGISG